MSSQSPTRFQKYVGMIKDAVFLASLIATLSTVAGSFVVAMVWPHFINQLSAELNVATKDDLHKFQQQINVLTGEDRIIRMPVGHSYVAEPVTQGDPIDLTLVLSRTRRGESCIFVSATPLFKDNRDIPFAGELMQPIKQISGKMERLQLKLSVPVDVLPGRVELTLSMKYSCPSASTNQMVEAYDETKAIFFQMDPLFK